MIENYRTALLQRDIPALEKSGLTITSL